MEKSRYARLSSFELSQDQFVSLRKLAKSLGLLFLSTPLDLPSANFLAGLVDVFKIASGDNDFYPLMECVAGFEKPIFISTGLSDLSHVRQAKQFIEERAKDPRLVILHCVSSYPTPPEQANLAAIQLLQRELDCSVGYSDHTIGVDACVAAVALGARVIEKHFTLDHHFSDFRDHSLSANPEDLSFLARQIPKVVTLLGSPEKRIQPCEEESLRAARRSIVAAGELRRGHRLDWSDFTWVRPAGGLRPGQEGDVVGHILKRDLSFGETILLTDLE